MSWWTIQNVDEIPSPALLVYPDRAEENLRRLIAIAGGTSRLRPHMKTHKLPEIARMHVALGLTRVKCATIAEAEMLASEGLTDVLLAYQPVGPAVRRLLQLAQTFPGVTFRAVVDDEDAARALSAAFSDAESTIDLLVDLDVGMHRTGIAPELAAPLYRLLATLPGVTPGGLHAYDGHLRDPDVSVRRAQTDAAFAQVKVLRDALQAEGLMVPRVVLGGTPTLPCHATREEPDLELSPGTVVFWDAGYTAGLPDMDFLHAALLLTRVVSKPGGTRVCLDLGHKAVASEMPHPRVVLLQPQASSLGPQASSLGPQASSLEPQASSLEPQASSLEPQASSLGPQASSLGPQAAGSELPATFIGHSEEHLVLETPEAGALHVGDVFYGIPWHVCPTVALHGQAIVVRNHRAVDRWHVTARERMITV